MHHCNNCSKSENEAKFGWRNVNGKRYLKHICNVCSKEYRKKFSKDPIKLKIREQKTAAKRKFQRANNINRDKWILDDARSSDRKRGRSCDLTREFIFSAISNPCTYCGESKIQMTLDRVDNSIGHTQSNVVSSCVRCNLLRKDMPYEAWMQLVPQIRKVREQGLFGEWTGQIHRAKK